MNPPPGKIRALLATSRVANIPSIVSNVWLGVAMGVVLTRIDADQRDVGPVSFLEPCLLILSGICLYVSGNFLNDWKDHAWDETHRPERALPSGMFKPGFYLGAACLLALTGFGVACMVNIAAGIVAMAIIACIVIYTVWHKEWSWTVLFMGLCRGLLPLLGAFGVMRTGTVVSTLQLAGCGGCALCCYIAGLSLSARSESLGVSACETQWLSRVLLVSAGLLMLLPYAWSSLYSYWLLIAPLGYSAWLGLCLTRFRMPVSRHVSALLAGIPLLDWIFLLPVLLAPLYWQTQPFQPDAFGIASAAIPPLAFLSALLLQRLAPAT